MYNGNILTTNDCPRQNARFNQGFSNGIRASFMGRPDVLTSLFYTLYVCALNGVNLEGK